LANGQAYCKWIWNYERSVANTRVFEEAVQTVGEQPEGDSDADLRKGRFASYLYFAAQKLREKSCSLAVLLLYLPLENC
jgi:hypothetical protein